MVAELLDEYMDELEENQLAFEKEKTSELKAIEKEKKKELEQVKKQNQKLKEQD